MLYAAATGSYRCSADGETWRPRFLRKESGRSRAQMTNIEKQSTWTGLNQSSSHRLLSDLDLTFKISSCPHLYQFEYICGNDLGALSPSQSSI